MRSRQQIACGGLYGCRSLLTGRPISVMEGVQAYDLYGLGQQGCALFSIGTTE